MTQKIGTKRTKIILGEKYGRLTIKKEVAPLRIKNTSIRRILCECSCGKMVVVRLALLKHGRVQSCGCLQKEKCSEVMKTHGMSRTKIYYIWVEMKKRCLNKKQKAYKNYGGRGIKVCKRWMYFENFYADMGEKPDGKSLERINNNLGYFKKNCKWATHLEQMRNTRRNIKYLGETAKEASIRLMGNTALISERINEGWSLKKAFITPVKNHKIMLTYNEETKPRAYWAKKYGIVYSTLRYKLKSGKTLEEVITTAVKEK